MNALPRLVLVLGLFSLAGLQAQPAPPRVPEGVKAFRDLAYVENGHERQKLDLFVPEMKEGKLPLIVWIHGGGWQNGSKEGCPPLRNGFTERGYAVASLNYRLSGHAVFPAQIEDCKAAIRWLRAHAAEYGLDPDRFGVWGSSAGGHLVALVGTSGDVKEFEKGPNETVSSRVQAVCDYYGPTDFKVFVSTPGYESHAKPDSPEAKLIGGAVLENPEKAAKVNPIAYVTPDDPAFLIVHGSADKVVPLNQSELLYEALKKAGVAVHFHTIRNAGHGGPGFESPVVKDLVEEFFADRLAVDAAPSKENGTSESAVEAAVGGNEGQGRPRITWEQVLRRDANGDGKISREEFAGPPALFDRLDTDKNGQVTKEEHEKLRPRP